MSIPDLQIPEIQIQPIFDFTKPVDIIPLTINVPACTYQHRDIKNTGNHNLLLDDPNGLYTVCDFSFPSFIPPVYNPNQMTIVEEPLPQGGDPEIPETETPKIPEEKKEKDMVVPECPGPKDQRVGDFRNSQKLEKVVSHRLSSDKRECITEYERVEWKEQFIPSAPQFVGVFSLALVGASAPLVLQLVRPLVKQAVSKLIKNKKK